jgi:imidazole glycerol-phosphate synthase subunit HisH
MKNILIVDYGMGNLSSVKKAIKYLGHKPIISNDFLVKDNFDFIVIPGVGSFGKAMNNLRKNELDNIIREQVIIKETPILGICLGMQLFADLGTEPKPVKGLGLIKGTVKKMDLPSEFLPHIGWNDISCKNNDFKEFDKKDFYFVHNYSFQPENSSDIIMTVEVQKKEFIACIRNKNVFGTQFHPEKSQHDGLNLLKYIFTYK